VAIYLLGLRGSGKTTIGRIVAPSLGLPFVDLDDITPGILGHATAAGALQALGLPAFRDAERQALDDPRVLTAGIVSLGGGTPTHPPCEAELRRRTALGDRLIYLRATPATLRERLATTNLAARPSLTGADPLAEIPTLWAQRDPLYQSLATTIIEVDGLSDRSVADLVEQG
jgi:shikimate kinase